jgi:small subunit ribosomal protein S6
MSESTPNTPPAAAAPVVQPPPHAAGTRLREYETIFLVRPDLAEDLVDKLVERMRGIVQRDGGKVVRVSNWGKKRTAYEVKKGFRAIYIHVLYLGDSKIVAEFERNLRMTDDVMKYQSVKISEDVDPNARPVEADVKLPGDPEVPERLARESEGFGGAEREGGFGRDRDRDRAPGADMPDDAEDAPPAE